MEIKPVADPWRPQVKAFMTAFWHSDNMVARARVHYPAEQEGFMALNDGSVVGLITFEERDGEVEITLLDSRQREQGLGTALLDRVKDECRRRGCRRLWLIITNDNLWGLRFFQKRDFDLVRLHHNALEASRKLKPQIPAHGQAGIPIRHELELEWRP